MYEPIYDDFLASDDTLRVYEDGRLLFSSSRDGLLPLLDYLDRPDRSRQPVMVFDKVMGNAAALLSIKAGSKEVRSPLGSRLAVDTLDEHGVKHAIARVIPCILQDNGVDMCPMEKLSQGKGPEDFFKAVSAIIRREDG